MASSVDRLSDLPDSLLCCNILSLLPLTAAIRTSVLCSRWRHLWKQMPCLDFSDLSVNSLNRPYRVQRKWVKHIVDNILLSLTKVDAKGVKRVRLDIGYSEIHIPLSVFTCHSLEDLELGGFTFSKIPSFFRGFLSLKICNLFRIVNLTDDKLQQFIAICPHLQELLLESCYHLENLIIRAPHLDSLDLADLTIKSLTVDCPRLVIFEVEFCDSLSKLQLNLFAFVQDITAKDSGSFGGVSIIKPLKTLSSMTSPLLLRRPLLTLDGSFLVLEELKSTAAMFKDMTLGKMVPEQDVAGQNLLAYTKFPNLKKVYIEITLEMRQDEIDFLAFLLANTPSLKVMSVMVPHCPKNIHNKMFKDQVLYLDRVSLGAEIRILNNREVVDAICMEMPPSAYDNSQDSD